MCKSAQQFKSQHDVSAFYQNKHQHSGSDALLHVHFISVDSPMTVIVIGKWTRKSASLPLCWHVNYA